jgi:transposase-like protein
MDAKRVLAHVPDKQRDPVQAAFKAIREAYRDSRAQADQEAAAFRERYRQLYPEAIACLERDWEACLTFYDFPETHLARIRTSNVIERLFEEVKKRSKKTLALRFAQRSASVSTPFRNVASCLLLFFAVVRGMRFQNVVMPD